MREMPEEWKNRNMIRTYKKSDKNRNMVPTYKKGDKNGGK